MIATEDSTLPVPTAILYGVGPLPVYVKGIHASGQVSFAKRFQERIADGGKAFQIVLCNDSYLKAYYKDAWAK